MRHKFVPPEPADRCTYHEKDGEDCRLPLHDVIHSSHIPPAILRAGRIESSNLQQLNDLQREKTDALHIMLESAPRDREDLRDGRLGNIVRFFVTQSRAFDRVRRDRDDAHKQILDLNREREALQQRILEAERALVELKPLRVAETDAEWPEDSGLPEPFRILSAAALDRFAEGYREYGPGAADPQGLAGQWGDLYRKVMKLRPSMWVGEGRLTRETEEDILHDIVGHCLLALEMYTRDFEGGRS